MEHNLPCMVFYYTTIQIYLCCIIKLFIHIVHFRAITARMCNTCHIIRYVFQDSELGFNIDQSWFQETDFELNMKEIKS